MTSGDKKPTKCDKCGADSQKIEFKQMMTFEYWYCHACGEEVNTDSGETNVGVYVGDEKVGYASIPSSSSHISQSSNPKPSVLADEVDFFHLARWMASQYNWTVVSELAHNLSNGRTKFEFEFDSNNQSTPINYFSNRFMNEMNNLIHPALNFYNFHDDLAAPYTAANVYFSFEVPIKSNPTVNANYSPQCTTPLKTPSTISTEQDFVEFFKNYFQEIKGISFLDYVQSTKKNMVSPSRMQWEVTYNLNTALSTSALSTLSDEFTEGVKKRLAPSINYVHWPSTYGLKQSNTQIVFYFAVNHPSNNGGTSQTKQNPTIR